MSKPAIKEEPIICSHPQLNPGFEHFDIFKRCEDDAELLHWIHAWTKLKIPTVPVCPHHHAPFDYVRKAYFEPAEDLIVWAPRGGGKTRLAALATLLDMMHKPGTSVRVLGGSLQQSMRIWEHLYGDLAEMVWGRMQRIPRGPRVSLRGGSTAEAIPHSERAVRGLHIQKLRCDEVELFDPAIYEAAQMTTRSITLNDGFRVRGSIESLSTLHKQWGLMSEVVDKAAETGRTVIKWCILDVLEKCPPERDCKSCPLEEDCHGAAKRAEGFFSIDDAIAIKRRTSRESWQAEMLCRRPSAKGAVFPTFDPDVHVKAREPSGRMTLAMDFGFNNPFVCLWIAEDGGRVYVFDEYVQEQKTLEQNLKAVSDRKPWPRVRNVACDPAGNTRNEQTSRSNTDIMRDHGYCAQTGGSHITDGLDLIRTGLQAGTGHVSLFMHPRCVKLIKAMQGYHFPRLGRDEKPEKDGVFDHPIDALRYFYINRRNRKQSGAVWRLY